MLQTKAFVKKTRRGKILKIVREHYLRDDIESGTPLDKACSSEAAKLSGSAKHYLVPDTNTALHQLDLLENAAVDDVILLSTVLQEVKQQNQSAYQRLRALAANVQRRFYVFTNEHHRETYVQQLSGESVNERNDRAIRASVAWYRSRLPASMPVLLLTSDADNCRRAQEEGLDVMSAAAYAASRTDAPQLQDVVAGGGAEDASAEAGGRRRKRQRVYQDHLPMSKVEAGIKAGRFHQGALRMNRFNPFEGYVSSNSVEQDILISGRQALNRAFDGDVVAVALLPEAEWKCPAHRLPTAAELQRGQEEREQERQEGDDAAGAGEGMKENLESTAFQVAHGESYGEEDVVGGARRPTGRVVGIIKRNWRSRGYCGSIQPPKGGAGGARRATACLFLPVERRVPLIRIHTRQVEQLTGQRIVVVIDTWEADSMYPQGHYVRTLGPANDRDTETEVLLLEHDVNTNPFTNAVHACVPPLPWSVTEQDLRDPGREDLRDRLICSVDPPGCKDIDDCLHARPLPNGNFELGVHIADVTHILTPGSEMDIEAAARATTVYLVQRRIDMLPKPLTEDICSLRSGVDRLTFSVLWEITPEALVVSTRFTKAVIRSRASLTYAEAQSRIDDMRMSDDLTASLRSLNAIARCLRRQRCEDGALQLASPEVKFEIDTETHDPLDIGMYQVREANQMVEEMMLLANRAVASHILKHFPACSLLRRHQTPSARRFEPLLAGAGAAGIQLDCSSSKRLAESLDNAVREDDPYFNKLVRILATRCMTQATYFSSGEVDPQQYHHYGLATPIYTHFTSPIRRYADVVVHRLLAAAIWQEPVPEAIREREHLHNLIDNLNVRHRNAQMAGRSSVELHTVLFFQNKDVVVDARVTKVKANGIIIIVPKYGIEGPIYLTGKEAKEALDKWSLDEVKQCVTSPDGSQRYTIFDKVVVRIKVETSEQTHRQHLSLSLIDNQAQPQGGSD